MTHLTHTIFLSYIPNFLLFSIISHTHFLTPWCPSSDPFHSEPTLHSMPYLGLAKARPVIPKSGNQPISWHKLKESQDWMHQFGMYLRHMESHDWREDVGGNGKGRWHGYEAVFQFESFCILFWSCFSFFSMVSPCNCWLLVVVFMWWFSFYICCIYSWTAGWCGYLT